MTTSQHELEERRGCGSIVGRFVTWLGTWASPPSTLPTPHAIAARAFGPDAADRLDAFIATQRDSRPGTWGPPEMLCVASVHYVQRWPDTPPERMGATPLAFEGERWFPCTGVRGWHALLRTYHVNLRYTEQREAAMAAFDALVRCQRVRGAILRTAEQAAALLEVPPSFSAGLPWSEPPEPADPAAIAAFAPPHVDDTTFRFLAVLRDEVARDALGAPHDVLVHPTAQRGLSVWRIEVSLALEPAGVRGPATDLRLARVGNAGTEGTWGFYR